jgi:hypothetical protein
MSAEHEQPTTEIDPREVVKAYIDRERADWLPHYRRAMRDGRMNAQLNAEADSYMPKIDSLLDELGKLSIAGTMQE